MRFSLLGCALLALAASSTVEAARIHAADSQEPIVPDALEPPAAEGGIPVASVNSIPVVPAVVHHETKMVQSVKKVFGKDADAVPSDPAPEAEAIGLAPSAGVPEIRPFEGFKVDQSLILDPAEVDPDSYNAAIRANQKQIEEQEAWLAKAAEVASRIKEQLVIELRKRRENQKRLSRIQDMYDAAVLRMKMEKLGKMLNDSNLLLRLLKAQVSVMPPEAASQYVQRMNEVQDRIKRIYDALYAGQPYAAPHVTAPSNVVSAVRDAKVLADQMGNTDEMLAAAAKDVRDLGQTSAEEQAAAQQALSDGLKQGEVDAHQDGEQLVSTEMGPTEAPTAAPVDPDMPELADQPTETPTEMPTEAPTTAPVAL